MNKEDEAIESIEAQQVMYNTMMGGIVDMIGNDVHEIVSLDPEYVEAGILKLINDLDLNIRGAVGVYHKDVQPSKTTKETK